MASLGQLCDPNISGSVVGIFLLLWAEQDDFDGLARVFAMLKIIFTIGVTCVVPIILVDKASPKLSVAEEGDHSQDGGIFCSNNDITVAFQSTKVWCAVLLMELLYMSLSTSFMMPRIFAYMAALKGKSLDWTCGWLHLGILTTLVVIVAIFNGTYFLFIQQNDIGNMVLNCVALTFFITAAQTVANTRKSAGPLGTALAKASMRIDDLMDSPGSRPVRHEW